MNAIKKAAFAASALAITLFGAALATAPMAFARPLPVVAHHGCTTVIYDAGMVALNRR